MNSSSGYALGNNEEEARRLESQAAFLEDLTEDVLRRAGVGSGMQVLDLGCGVGDVSLLASRLVGATGYWELTEVLPRSRWHVGELWP
jgi:cyclopropane fatty-acyl-phospholipid synthase-like methyltransferase